MSEKKRNAIFSEKCFFSPVLFISCDCTTDINATISTSQAPNQEIIRKKWHQREIALMNIGKWLAIPQRRI